MMTKEEIMKVLDAMNYAISPSGTFWVKKHNEAKQILQAALAEPSEPAGTFQLYEGVYEHMADSYTGDDAVKLFTHPAIKLDDDRIADLENSFEIERLKAENAAIRTLMDCYNVGGWTDSLTLIQERDKCKAALRVALDAMELHFDGDIGEHSSSNSPWDRALDLLDSAACAETMRLSKQAALAEPSEPVAWTESAIDEYLSGYSLIGDDGDYTPTDDEKFVIKDAILGFMSETPETKKYPSIEDIQQAVALGWCSDRNLLKRMDSDLATDIADQVYALLNRETP